MTNTTIAAISTAQGSGGIGVIRISGERAVEIADSVFVSVSGRRLAALSGYTAAYGRVFDESGAVDEVIATVFRAPHSYTGENIVELSCHGGVYITARVLRAVLDAGAAPAEAGEFTKRAFLNGKIDLTAAEAVMEIIGAKSSAAARAALNLKDGALCKKINAVRDSLVSCAAHLNAWADYPEDEVPEVSADELYTEFNAAERELEALLKTYDSGKAVFEGIDTIIAGKPNVGKSTLMNLLAGCEKSIVTDLPGTTRDIIEETVTLGGVVLRLSDTAGLRDADNPVEKIGVERTRSRLETCGLIIAVFDASVPLDDEDFKLINQISSLPCVAVINKTDLDIKADIEYIKNKINKTVEISAKNGEGAESLAKAISEAAGAEDFDPSQPVIANERQRSAVRAALEGVRESILALEMGMTFDAVTVTLEDALSALFELTGERASDAVIDKVFHNFCVGK